MTTSSGALFSVDMLRGHQIYRNKAGDKLPGVTTVLNLLAKPALIAWANRMGLQGIDTTKYVQKAADIGTIAHARVEAFLRGLELDESGLDPVALDKSTNSFVRFHDWWKEQKLEVVSTELQMVSERWQVGGTADIVAVRPDGGLVLVDIKTGSGIYPEMKIQVSAYAEMYDELNSPIADVYIVRIGKEENDDLEAVKLGPNVRANAVEAFGKLAELHRLLKSIK